MKTLIFDDKPTIGYSFKKILGDMGHTVMPCKTCSKVIEVLENELFDCYIVDLNAATIGLSEMIQLKTKGGLLTGWFLLTEHILKKDPDGIDKIIIFSDYITQLRDYIVSEKASDEERGWFSQLGKNRRVLSKSDGFNVLRDAVTLIAQQMGVEK